MIFKAHRLVASFLSIALWSFSASFEVRIANAKDMKIQQISPTIDARQLWWRTLARPRLVFNQLGASTGFEPVTVRLLT